ncbi:gamma-glutamyl hydrolase [Diabrotica virgifera virgifera]|uniref:folate gamma-glutamyl hydrolase n=1 Tax=Diabrotica virgifera virgifera TaxID=50390 RepID=A0A6P7FDC1_DIAVI|nr:gamma-glutamyl hydrolase [Diabrotica virgifera virgifera]XP_028131359.1 gamma-glutamyl hydrolase [Diabrotica virgifera virgifera]XP_028131360.1 gamma-glutamyl hydrolase [Diabrotica virgifera virgifera]
METPIIGILSQETYIVSKYLPERHNYSSFIAASYVKFLESAGARVIPVWIGQRKEYYEKVVSYTNGILFPGGGTYFNETDGYGETARQIYNLAVELNNKGIYYPVWGICLGMQALVFSQLGTDIRIDRILKNVALPLEFIEGYEKSKMYSRTPKQLIQILGAKNVTYNFHRYGLTEDVLRKHEILDDWNILTTNKDARNLRFISSMESKKYPIYGLQFHPEKNIFEFQNNTGIPHSSGAIRVSQFFATFFVDECRKNNNSFPDEYSELRTLIYNYNPLYTGIKGSSYEQLYAFTENDYKRCPLVDAKEG